jgi:acylphosphatase
MSKKCISLKVYGLVQGVWFRASTKKVADEMGVKGLVRNESDGTVYIEAEADAYTLAQFTLWCHNGPDGARVEQVKVQEIALKNYTDFKISR